MSFGWNLPPGCSPNDPYFNPPEPVECPCKKAEVFPGGLTVTSHDPDPTTTAYGMLADLVAVVR